MDHFSHLWLFFLMVLGIIVLPGLDMAFVLASSLTSGHRAGLVAVAGIVAGGMTKTKTVGVVASVPIPEVVRNINSFVLGAQSVDPSIKAKVVWVNEGSARRRRPRPPPA